MADAVTDVFAADEQQLAGMKAWFFKENIRINEEKAAIEHEKERMAKENELFEKKLEILKDSHVGSFAVIGVVLLILCQFAFCVSFNQKTDIRVLIVIPVVSRCGSALAVALLPKMSTSQYVRKQAKAADIWIPCAFLAGALVFAFSLRFRCGLVLLVQAAGYGLALRKAYRSLEGMNGDISGYALTVSELSALGALAIL